ncbi:MAG: hypothetical protein M5U13_04200 [Thermoanaerobaculia bacterium]|nr:hypothetical protein [Thermoanaerobaculia bacterium]
MTDTQLTARLDRLAAADLGALHGRSLLATQDWSTAEIELLCQTAELLELLDRAGVPTRLFPHELHLALFFDASTRTKSSWAGAAARLGASPVILEGARPRSPTARPPRRPAPCSA